MPMDQNKPKKLKYGWVGSLSLIIFVVCVALVYIVSNLPALESWFGGLFTVFTPVIVGLAFAYLCNPIVNFIEKHPLRRIRSVKIKRMLSILFAYLFFILCIALLGILLIPQLIRSFQELFANYNNYIANSVKLVEASLSQSEVPAASIGSYEQMFKAIQSQDEPSLISSIISNLWNYLLGGTFVGLFIAAKTRRAPKIFDNKDEQ